MIKPTKRILCFGDSNTWGYNPKDGSRYPSEIRWTGVLQKFLGNQFYIIEEGLNGRTTRFDYKDRFGKNGLEYLRPCLDSHFPLDLVIICLGTNDSKQEFGLTSTEIAEGLDACLEAIKGNGIERPSPNIKIILMSPILVNEKFINYDPLVGSEAKTKEFSKKFQTLAKKHHAEFIDLAAEINPSEADGCHLDPEDHLKIAEILKALVEKIFSTSPIDLR